MNNLATAAIEPRLIMVPLAQLNPITNGVRRTSGAGGVSVDELAASIAAEGLLQNLTVYPDPDSPLAGAEEFQRYIVSAGGRRLQALNLLAKQGKLPADYAVACLVIDKAQSLTSSTAENVMRQEMHPADEFIAFREMIAQGKSIEDVSARFGVTPIAVQRRLKLANVAPKLFELFRKDEISLAQMMALALVDDHVAQLAAWGKDNSAASWQRAPDQLRKALTKKEISLQEDPVAKFVGRQDYERAGGVVHSDLFSDTGGGYVSDVALLQTLAAKKLEQAADKVRKEAWSWVETRPSVDHADLYEFKRAEPNGQRKLTDVEKKFVNELAAERNKIDARLNALNDDESEAADAEATKLQDRRDEIAIELEDLDNARTKWASEVLAQCGAIVTIDRGKVKVHRGLAKGKLRQAKDTKKGKAAAGATVAQQPGHSEALMRELTAAATFAIAAEMIAQPGSAVIALTHRLALKQFYPTTSTHSHPVKIEHEHTQAPNQALRAERLSMAVDGNADIAKLGAERIALQAMLPKKSDELLAWLIKDAGKTVQRLLVYCVAESVDVIAGDEKDHRALPLAAALKLDMRPRWTARRDNYLGRVNAATILAALTEAKVDKAIVGKAEKLKKSELVDLAQPLLKNWLPKLLRFGTAQSIAAKTKDRS